MKSCLSIITQLCPSPKMDLRVFNRLLLWVVGSCRLMHKTKIRPLHLADIFQSVCVCRRGISAEMLPKLREPAACVVCVLEKEMWWVQFLPQNSILLVVVDIRRSNIGCLVFDCVNQIDFETSYFQLFDHLTRKARYRIKSWFIHMTNILPTVSKWLNNIQHLTKGRPC